MYTAEILMYCLIGVFGIEGIDKLPPYNSDPLTDFIKAITQIAVAIVAIWKIFQPILKKRKQRREARKKAELKPL